MNQPQTRVSRLGGIDLLRCFFALEIIVLHMTSKSRYSDELNGWIQHLGIYIGGAVAGFFLLSGFFARQQQSFDVSQIKAIFQKNLLRLGVPFFFFSFIYAFAMAGLHTKSLSDGLRSTFMLQGSGMQLYFLPYLFCVAMGFILVSSVLGQLKWNQLVFMLGIWALLTLLSLALPSDASFGPNLRLLPLYASMYVLGHCFFALLSENNSAIKIFVLSVLILMVLAALVDFRFVSISIAFLLFIIATIASYNSKLKGKHFYGSGGVYLLHTPITNFAISTILAHFGCVGYANLLVSVLLTYSICMAFTIWFVSRFNALKFFLLE